MIDACGHGKGMAVLTFRNCFAKDTDGDAVVEAAILFPIMIMIFAALVLLAIYLPTRATLQRATQYAATAIATEQSDEWLFYDKSSLSYYWERDKSRLANVYEALFSGGGDVQGKGEEIVTRIEGRSLSSKAGTLSVDCYMENKIIYKEVVVTATRVFTVPIGLSFIGFPDTVPITVASTAVVQNGDEFVRSIDIAVDFVKYISEKLHLDNITDNISSYGNQLSGLLGWKKAG